MIFRIAVAYGMAHALVGSLAAISVGILAGQHVIGVTRQPLPLIWPLCVVLVVAVQLPLREILAPIERVAERAVTVRAFRAGLSLLLVSAAIIINELNGTDAALQVFLLLLVSVGFAVTALTRMEAWAWTLGVGMAWVGVQFVTPLGEEMAKQLSNVGVVTAALLTLLTAMLYTSTARLTTRFCTRPNSTHREPNG